ncbi:MAG TPA: helix-turn-helix transcriptional regulator [Thermoanaerobaculia bacterium]|jgi:AraC-like DNA-binding protein|nr:helix-turn-helix transcriptional regulator [Thermoanaerobaculia bacterium]
MEKRSPLLPPSRAERLPLLDHATFARLCRGRDFLAAELAESPRLAAAAAQACLSPFHFHRLFVRAFGETPLAFVTRRRMERAKELLAGGAAVTDACFAVGYGSLGTFSSRFRELVGCPPSEYRRHGRLLVQVPGLWLPRPIPACFRAHWLRLAA